LQERGHECALYTGSAGGAPAKAEGLTWFPFRALDDAWFDRLIYGKTFSRIRALQMAQLNKRVQALILESIPDQVRDIKQISEQWRPDVLVTETMMWGPYLILHEEMKIPVAVFSTVPACTVPGEDVPPFGLGLPPPRNRKARLLDATARKGMRVLSMQVTRRTNRIRKRFGLPAVTVPGAELAGRMPLYLVPTLREFDYDRTDLPPSVHYVGLCQWSRTAQWNEAGTSLDHLGTRPCVHVTEGTIHVQKPIVVKAAVKGLADLPMDVIITIGPNRESKDLGIGDVPDNIRIEKFVPHEDLLPLTDVLVTTGGAGSLHAALSTGVPMVVVPTEWDKYDNAQRVVEAGVGVRLSVRRCTPDALRGAVETVLRDTTYRDRAVHFARLFSERRGSERAAELLEDLAATSSGTDRGA
jgi:MGT family glycosyltransferase